MRIAVFKQQ